jgi:glycosyltransferase involved in cell wall biosynthesis
MFYVNSLFLTKRITGLERYATELSLALKKNRPETIFLSSKNNSNNCNKKKLNPTDVGNLRGYLWEQFELPLYLKRAGNPLLVNLTNTCPLIYRNQILVIHDVAFIHNPDWYSKKAALFFNYIVKKSAKAAKKIITVSEFSKKEIIKYLGIPKEKIEVVYSGVPQGILNHSERKLENKYGDYIFTVSTLEPRKNLISLIRAFKKLNNPGLKLLIAGEKNLLVFKTPELEKNDENNIIFLGYVDDETLVNLYQNTCLFVYLSLYEGFGFPPVEAIALGCPTLVSNRGSLPEVCGEFAEYTDPLNIDEIAQKIESMISREFKNSMKKVEKFCERYNWQNSAERFLTVINELEK